jgi:hypothetical protein
MGMDLIMVRTCMSPMDITGPVDIMDTDTAIEGGGLSTYVAAKVLPGHQHSLLCIAGLEATELPRETEYGIQPFLQRFRRAFR